MKRRFLAAALSLVFYGLTATQSPGKALLGIQGLPGTGGDFARAEEAGVGLGVILGRWDEPEPGQYNSHNNGSKTSDLGAYLRGLKEHGLATHVMIANVHKESLQMPRYLEGKPFDDPYVLERWEIYLTGLLERYGESIDYISIGNELDRYFSQNGHQFPGFVKFLAKGAEVIRREAPQIEVGATLQVGNVDRWWPQLEPYLDYLGATYQAPPDMFGKSDIRPLDEASPAYFTKALARVLQAAGGKRVIFTRLGCATASEECSSPEAQAEFIHRFFQWLPEHDDRIAAVQFIGVQDWPHEGTRIASEPLIGTERLAGEAFTRSWTSLGLDDELEEEKQGWRAWLDAAREHQSGGRASVAAVGSLATGGLAATTAAQATRPEGIRWQDVRGVNYFSSNASNAHEMWREFDEQVVERELRWLREIGFNSVRLWLSVPAYGENPSRFLANLRRCLDICKRNELTAMVVLFDSCGIEPREGAVEMSIHEAYQRLLAADRLSAAERNLIRSRYHEFATRRGKHMRIPFAPDTPYDVLFWQNWQPNPGFRNIGRERWQALERYVDDVTDVGREHPAVISIDIMNEPGCLFDLPQDVSPVAAVDHVEEFVRHFAARVEKRAPEAAITVGSANIEAMKRLADVQDVLSVHSYAMDEQLASLLQQAREFAEQRNKPILLTECLANTDNWLKTHGEEARSSDEAQLDHYRTNLPIILESGLGWYSWGGVVGQMFTPFTEIIYPNGYLRPAAVYLEEQLTGID